MRLQENTLHVYWSTHTHGLCYRCIDWDLTSAHGIDNRHTMHVTWIGKECDTQNNKCKVYAQKCNMLNIDPYFLRSRAPLQFGQRQARSYGMTVQLIGAAANNNHFKGWAYGQIHLRASWTHRSTITLIPTGLFCIIAYSVTLLVSAVSVLFISR